MLLQLTIGPVNINIIQLYDPTTDHDNSEVVGDWTENGGKETTEDVTGQ